MLQLQKRQSPIYSIYFWAGNFKWSKLNCAPMIQNIFLRLIYAKRFMLFSLWCTSAISMCFKTLWCLPLIFFLKVLFVCFIFGPPEAYGISRPGIRCDLGCRSCGNAESFDPLCPSGRELASWCCRDTGIPLCHSRNSLKVFLINIIFYLGAK